MRPRFAGAARETFTTLAPEMSLPMRVLFANLWLTRPLIVRRFAAEPRTNALLRTTIAPTMLEASPKANVLATSARAIVNVRLLPEDAVDSVMRHMRSAIDDDRVTVTVPAGEAGTAPPISPTETGEFARLGSAIRSVYPDVLVAPLLTVGATDSRFYTAIAPRAYRFLPVHFSDALDVIHGIDERIPVDAYANAIRTYATIIKEMAGS
jgi:carboxypeptidase PM20D1